MITEKATTSDVSKLSVFVRTPLRSHMKAQASLADEQISKVWEEAAILYLQSKGIFFNENLEQVDGHIAGNQQNAKTA